MLTVRLDDVPDVCNIEVALLIQRIMSLIEFSVDVFQGMRFFDGETAILLFGPQLISRSK